MPEKMPKDHYMVLNTLEATGAPLPACEFKNIARKFIGGDVEQGDLQRAPQEAADTGS